MIIFQDINSYSHLSYIECFCDAHFMSDACLHTVLYYEIMVSCVASLYGHVPGRRSPGRRAFIPHVAGFLIYIYTAHTLAHTRAGRHRETTACTIGALKSYICTYMYIYIYMYLRHIATDASPKPSILPPAGAHAGVFPAHTQTCSQRASSQQLACVLPARTLAHTRKDRTAATG